MNPSNNNETIQLPTPTAEQGQVAVPNQQVSTSPETAQSGEGSATTSAVAPMPTSIPLPTPPSMPITGQTLVSGVAGVAGNPAQASDDADLIEKEWVNKAKTIVERTKDDPYKQSEELTVFKADYMKKRYNRAIKLK